MTKHEHLNLSSKQSEKMKTFIFINY